MIDQKTLDEYYKNMVYFTLNMTSNEKKGKFQKKPKMPLNWSKLKQKVYNSSHNAVAILTGEMSGIVSIDYDSIKLFEKDRHTFPEIENNIDSTNKGYHCNFLYDERFKNFNWNNKKLGVDFRSNGGCLFAPPTKYVMNESIIEYKKLKNNELAKMSDDLFKHLLVNYKNTIVQKEPKKVKNDIEISDINLYKSIVKCLSEKRATEYESWLKVGFALFNCSIKNDVDLSEIFNLFSSTSDNYYGESDIMSFWRHFSYNEDGFGIGSLLYWAKNDNMDLYKKTVKKFVRKNYHDNSEDNDLQKLRNFLLQDAKENCFKKEDGYILKKVVNNYYEPYLTYGEYVNDLFKDEEHEEYHIFRRRVKNRKDILEYLDNYNDSQLSFIKRNNSMYAFNNGVLDIDEMKFIKDCDINICCGKWFDIKFDEDMLTDNLETPLFDKLCLTQIEDPEIYKYFLAFLGRLFYPVGKYDNFQCIPFLLGQANTGKSTVFEILGELFYNIANISDNTEDKFGLEGLFNKQVILCPEIPNNIKNIIPRTQFQSMVSGETINVARKNKVSISKKWTVPLFFAGNYLPNYQDKSGSISRRLAIFKFENEVKDKDTKLKNKIIDTEMIKIFIKLIKSYQWIRQHHPEKAFEDWDIEYFKESRNELKADTNLLYQFLTSDNKYYRIEYIEGNVEPLESLKQKFSNFIRYNHPGVKEKWTSDNKYTLKKQGFNIARKHLCNSCDNIAKKGCCTNYNPKNRKRKFIIENIKITSLKNSDDYGSFHASIMTDC